MIREIEEIINVIDRLSFRNIISYSDELFGALATYLTIAGLSLSTIFPKLLDLKNRKTVKYVICNKVKNYAIHFGPVSLVLDCIKLTYYFLFPAIFSEFSAALLSMHGNYKLIISTQITLIIISYFVKKIFIRSENSISKIIAKFLPLIVIVQIYFMAMTYSQFIYRAIVLNYIILDCYVLFMTYAHNKNKVLVCKQVSTQNCAFAKRTDISCPERKVVAINYLCTIIKNKVSFLPVVLRHIILYLVFNQMLHGFLTNTNISVGLILWELSVVIELLIRIITSSDIMPVKIHTVECVKTTKSRIMQYECNKIKYKLEDGTIEVVDEDVILYMSYNTPERPCSTIYKIIDMFTHIYMRFKKYPLKNLSVECIFKGKELEKIQTYEIKNYRYIQESWICMEVKNGDYKSYIIVNANRVKKIVCRNKEP